jgi:hypothetical protein
MLQLVRITALLFRMLLAILVSTVQLLVEFNRYCRTLKSLESAWNVRTARHSVPRSGYWLPQA